MVSEPISDIGGFSLDAGVVHAWFSCISMVQPSDVTLGDATDLMRGFVLNTDDVPPESWRLMDRFHYLEVPIGVVMELGQGR